MSSYYIAKNGNQTGPFEEEDVRRQITAGQLGIADLCWCEGMANWLPIGTVFNMGSNTNVPPPSPILANIKQAGDKNAPLFLYIPISRLIVLSIVSMSLYEAYWIYKNWRFIKERDQLNIKPFWRGVFGLFYCHSLLRRIHEDPEARAVQMPSFSPGGLATGWVILMIVANAISRAPGIAASIVSAFIPSFLCFVPIQVYINSVCQRQNPSQPYYRWSSGHVVCLIIGIIIWALVLIGLGVES